LNYAGQVGGQELGDFGGEKTKNQNAKSKITEQKSPLYLNNTHQSKYLVVLIVRGHIYHNNLKCSSYYEKELF
jgi:hypothetical protein